MKVKEDREELCVWAAASHMQKSLFSPLNDQIQLFQR